MIVSVMSLPPPLLPSDGIAASPVSTPAGAALRSTLMHRWPGPVPVIGSLPNYFMHEYITPDLARTSVIIVFFFATLLKTNRTSWTNKQHQEHTVQQQLYELATPSLLQVQN